MPDLRKPLLSALLLLAPLPWFTAALAAPPVLLEYRPPAGAVPFHARAGSAVSGAFNTRALAGPAIEFRLPDGRVMTARRDRLDDDPARGKRSWVGTFPGESGSLVVLTTFRGTTTGFLSFGTETWELLPDASGARHLFYRVDEERLPAGEDILRPEAAFDGPRATSADYGSGGATPEASTNAAGYVHDLLVVYTPAARVAWGRSTLESMIVNAVAAANQAYLNSKVAITLNLVGLQEIAYSESGSAQTSLYDLRGTSDGKMDGVHTLRNDVGADLVSLVTEDTSSCGMAWIMTNESTAFASYAFSVVKTACLAQHSLAHEVGHNQGNEHDRASSSGYDGAFPYSYGFRRCLTDGTGFRTVMAYSCSGAARVAWFSNPNVTYNGYATGIAYESSPANSSDNARSMNNSADTVAAFRAAKAGSAPTAPTGLASTGTSTSSVSLKWTDTSSNESGFTLQRSGNGVDFVDVAGLGANVTTHLDDGLLAGRDYWYRVRAYNGSGTSAFSNTLAVTTATTTTPTAALSGFVLARSTIAGCKNVSGKVTLTAPAPSGGFAVSVSDTLQNALTPATVTVPAGATSVSFVVRSTAVVATQSGSVSVRAGSTLSQSLTLRPIGVQSVVLAKTSVTGGNSVDGTVKLECPAPQATALTAAMSSSLPGIAKPTVASLTFQPGVQSLAFKVSTARVSSVGKPRIRASVNGMTKSAVLTVNP